METSTKALGVLGAAALALAVAVLVDRTDPTGKPYATMADGVGAVPVMTKAEVGDLASRSKLASLADGGVAAYVVLDDGGLAVLDAMPCVRKPKGGACTKLDGGDPGNWNRYPAGQLVGPQCEPAPCSVWAGQKADPDEP